MKKSPWGVLTGVRPTKKTRKLLSEGVKENELPKVLKNELHIKKSKIKLLQQILNNQQIVQNEKMVDFYVNIPICPTRCSYCSFISSELKAVENILPTYLEKLKQEIVESKKITNEKNLNVRSVYIGGGTPSVLTPDQLEFLLKELQFNEVTEFTVECGRPDTITKQKLEVLKRYGVTRISINPQTFCQKTLDLLGRKHGVDEVFSAYKIAEEIGFNINMDLIAGLEGESLSIFKNSLWNAINLCPQNITVHTLSIKKGSCLQGKEIKNNNVEKMVNYAYKKLTKCGFVPYYMYRQKHQLGNLENIGYCKPNFQCVFNVDSMEETVSIMACGANAISKIVDIKNKKISRFANVKFLHDYINRFDDEIKNKIKFFENI